MSTANAMATTLRYDLKNNEDIMLITSAEELLMAWRKKQEMMSGSEINDTNYTSDSNFTSSKELYNNLPVENSGHPTSIGSEQKNMNTKTVSSNHRENIAETIRFVDTYLADRVVPAKDTFRHVIPIVKDLGFLGKIIIKEANNVEYIIIKGYAGRRSFLTGTKYLSTHPKMLQLAIGKTGLQKTIRGGGVLNVCITISLELLKVLIGEKELRECGIAIASDLVKIGISTVIAEVVTIAALGSASAGVVAVGPIILAIVVGVSVTKFLDDIDEQFGITDKVVALIQDAAEKISHDVNESVDRASGGIYEGLRHFIWHMSGGIDVNNPMSGMRLR